MNFGNDGKIFKQISLTFIYLCMCVCVCAHSCHSAWVTMELGGPSNWAQAVRLGGKQASSPAKPLYQLGKQPENGYLQEQKISESNKNDFTQVIFCKLTELTESKFQAEKKTSVFVWLVFGFFPSLPWQWVPVSQSSFYHRNTDLPQRHLIVFQ